MKNKNAVFGFVRRVSDRVAMSLNVFPWGVRFVPMTLWVLGLMFLTGFGAAALCPDTTVIELTFLVTGLVGMMAGLRVLGRSYELDMLLAAEQSNKENVADDED